jgi:predicted nucleic acid-binding protein
VRLYLDASPVIFWVENVPGYFGKVDQWLKQPGTVLVSSHLVRMECLIRPLRAGDATLIQEYEDFFAAEVAELVPFTGTLFRRAAQIRADHNFKTPDSLHLAAALEAACDVFLTNDAGLKGFPDIAVEAVS